LFFVKKEGKKLMAKGKNVSRRGIKPAILTREQINEMRKRVQEAGRSSGRGDREVPGLTPETRNSSYGGLVGDLSFPVGVREREF